MVKILKESGRLNETLLLGLMSFMSFSFLLFRIFYSKSFIFVFLVWNLFLAFVPWALTSIAILKPRIKENKVIYFFIIGIWLLFFPNAPYILTDLLHLKIQLFMPEWYDMMMILVFSWTGLLFGFLSLWDIEQMLSRSLNKTWVTIVSCSLLFIGSFGVYLGRYMRWNSWDLFTEPFRLIFSVADIIINPPGYPAAWGITIFMGVFLNMVYWSFKLIIKRNNLV